MIGQKRTRGMCVVPFLALAGACASEPLEMGEGDLSNAGSNGETPELEVPDYSTSPCHGRAQTTERYDGETHTTVLVNATCRGEGARTLLFVEDALFGGRVTQESVNQFLYHYELVGNARSFRPDLGILPTDEAVFGTLPESQLSDGKLPVFVIDSKGGGDGYLCGWCSRPELHLDAVQLGPLDGEKALAVAAHESFHVIHRGYDAREASWVDETLAEAAMVANGFTDAMWLSSFLARPNTNWGPATQDATEFHYGGGIVFGAYLWDYGGVPLLSALTQDRKRGWEGIYSALAATGSNKTGEALFLDMAVALYVNDVEKGWGFRSLSLPSPVVTAELADGAATGSVQPYGLVYYTVPSAVSSLIITGGTALRARLVIDRDPLEIRDIELGTKLELDDAPSLLILTSVGTSSATRYSVTPG